MTTIESYRNLEEKLGSRTTEVPDWEKEYAGNALNETKVNPDPLRQFIQWLDGAIASEPYFPHAATLATVTKNAGPAARVVLLKGLDERGLVFFTNYESQKGKELDHNPQASLLFFWPTKQQQVRIDGVVEKVSVEESEAYFKTRPQFSKIAAWASHQSAQLENRAELEEKMAKYKAQYPGDVPRPEYWGGYRLVPNMYEFWQGRPNRLHDRLEYQQDKGNRTWNITRLSP